MWKLLDGQRFGRLTVIGRAPKPPSRKRNSSRLWNCKCDCGKLTVVQTSLLNNGHVKSCGCLFEEVRRPNLLNQKFGRLTVIEACGVHKKHARWRCQCECGKQIVIQTGSLRHHVRSCGCLRKPSKLRLQSGEAMRNYVFKGYENGAKLRGLEFDLSKEQASALFAANCHYCGERPSQVASKPTAHGEFIYNGIDRKDNSLGYSASNCVTCCSVCNVRKGADHYDQFIRWILTAASQFQQHERTGLPVLQI